MRELRIEVDVRVDQPWNRVEAFAIEHLAHADRGFVGVQRDDALVVHQDRALVDRLAVHVEDVQILQQEIGFLLPVENVENRAHLVVMGCHLVALSGGAGRSLADCLVHDLSRFHRLI